MRNRAEEKIAPAFRRTDRERVSLEAELIEMFATLMKRAPIERVNAEIQLWLGRILSAFDLDRGSSPRLEPKTGWSASPMRGRRRATTKSRRG